MKIASFAALLGLILLTNACSNEKNTFITRSYHNTTAKYNVYYNANDIYKQAQKRMQAQYPENFSDILPIEIPPTQEAAQQLSADMDLIIQKSKKLIKLHSITAKPKRPRTGNLSTKDRDFNNLPEYCKWVDDAYLLIGKANYYKTDTEAAHRTFDYIQTKYPKQPVSQFAALWKAKTYMAQNKLSDAENYISQVRLKNNSPKKLVMLYHKTYTQWYIYSKNYKKARLQLNKAIEISRNKDEKIRWTYILAQLNQQEGRNEDAMALFRKIIKMNPPYEMTFNASVNLANSFDSSIANSADLINDLEKMLKDDKNIDYQDRIYYAIGNVYLKDNQESKAVEMYRKSIQTSLYNPNQKAQSFLAIADIAFKNKAYTQADAYYDSTVQYISADYKRYDEIVAQTKSLKKLTRHLRTIEEQDSLLRMALMSEKQRNSIIAQAIAEYQQQKRLEEERQRQLQGMNQGNEIVSVGGNPNLQSGKWYFYNPSSLSFGKNEFVKRWGNRKLADNWRRSNKAIAENQNEEILEENNQLSDSAKAEITPDKVEYYTQNIPFNKEEQTQAHQKIIEAYFLLSEAYLQEMNAIPDAIASLEMLQQKYPANKYEVDVFYKLYLLNKGTNNTKANKYKQLLVSKYPQSMYAQRLSDPDFDKKIAQKQKTSEQEYAQLLQNYNQKNFATVIAESRNFAARYQGMQIAANALYLLALSEGANGNQNNMLGVLENIVQEYPHFSQTELVNAQITMLKSGQFDTSIYSKAISGQSVLALLVANDVQLAAMKFALESTLVDFSRSNSFTVEELSIAPKQFLIVQTFESSSQAQAFKTYLLEKNQTLQPNNILIFSTENFKTFKTDKNPDKYQLFFDQNYR